MASCANPLQLPTASLHALRRQAGRGVIPPPRPRRRPRSAAAAAMDSGGPSPVVLGCGAINVDYLATVASFPNPDDKIRSLELKVQGGGNTGNALTAAARLGLRPRIISKVANDAQGRNILSELQADGIDTSYILVAEDGNSPFTYIIVDQQTKTRTCIHTPGSPPLVPEELTKANLSSALDGADIVYFDVRLHDTALLVAEEASQRKIPILIDAERKREGLDELLNFASYVVCSAKFPQAWTGASSLPVALVSMLSRQPKIKFVIVTLGEKGCLMLERSMTGEIDAEALLESLQKKVDQSSTIPKCIASKSNLRISVDGVGSISGRLLLGTAEVIPPGELIDTTGAGDAFIGAVLYGLCTGMPPESMLPFAAQVRVCKICRLVAVAEVWELAAAFLIARTHAWLAIDQNWAELHPN
ncbi:sulfofructose kinase-like isoform X2 [Panicum virgatum]|uniref:sulfofructose kinase-like isoform X2 n=1 Tax=Panicum virgatum TaxID=38727 RepID=UPI0019D56887|nr:sulfofructose kinase-like isoform X2 [Panicum virgatum]